MTAENKSSLIVAIIVDGLFLCSFIVFLLPNFFN